MHPTLLEWLATFDEVCQENGGHEQCSTCPRAKPTHIYNSLVMLGIERPNMPRLNLADISSSGCDCLEVIGDEQKNVDRCEEDIRNWHANKLGPFAPTYQWVLDKKSYIAKCQGHIALYNSMHQEHASFNRRVHFILRNTCSKGMIAKLRKVCLRDLRNQKPIAIHSYGKELKTFLVDEPQGWF